jgi:alkylated DNA repair dioxygenase AlkB
MSETQQALFQEPSGFPEGFRYKPEIIDRAAEKELIGAITQLEFAPFEFHGFVGKRRVVSFGWRYDFNGGGLKRIDDVPALIKPAREAAAHFSGIPISALEQVLVTEYAPGAAMGWHKDRSVFGDVVGLSLSAACSFRFRRKVGAGWGRRSFVAEPRSAYLLQGPSRSEWEHSIPAVDSLRYSLTFRTLRK